MHYDPERITFFAKTDARGKELPFGIKAKDRSKHMYVIGKTGMGKSTMLENMAIQDIKNGEGMAFIDPHGSTAEKLLDYVPEERIKDVLYFAPFDMEYPISFNVMEDVGPDKRHLVVSGLMSTFKKIWVDAWSARMEYILSNTLLALLEYPGSTLLGVNRMLADKTYRDAVVANVKDPGVKSFWVDEFAKYTDRFAAEATPAIQNKIGQFTANPLIRNIIGQPKSSFDVRKMMDEKKILIINLSKGLVGETNANLLGSMMITRIYLAAMSRADLSAAQMAKMPNFYFYVDEFQSFANETFANILSEARKYKLNLTIAHQYIEQMEEEVRNAVFGNVGTTIAFRVGPFDAEILETVFAPQFTATDIVNLGFAQIYLSLMIDGMGSHPFSAITLPPIAPAEVSNRDRIIAASRAQYAHPREEIEGLIATWHEPMKKPETKNNQNGPKGSGPAHGQSNNASRPSNHKLATPERVTPPQAEVRAVTPREEKSEEKSELVHQDIPKESPVVRPNERSESKREERPAERRTERPAHTQEKREERQSPPRRDTPRPPRPESRTEPQSAQPPKEKQLSDLRSVLQSITKDAASSAPSNKVEPQRELTKTKNDASKNADTKADLKAALTSVLERGREEKLAEKAPEPKVEPKSVENPQPNAPTPSPRGPTAAELEAMLRLSRRDHEPPVHR